MCVFLFTRRLTTTAYEVTALLLLIGRRILPRSPALRLVKDAGLGSQKMPLVLLQSRYGIVYHANYITYVQRAMERVFSAPGVRVHSLFSMKYRAAATLGEEIAVQGSLVSCDTEGKHSHWRFELTDAADQSRVFVSAEAIISWPGGVDLPAGMTIDPLSSAEPKATTQADAQLLQPLPEAFVDAPKTLEVIVWSDDLDGGGELSIRSVLNYFERIRTLSLGRGPDGELGLVRLHREGVSIVVREWSLALISC